MNSNCLKCGSNVNPGENFCRGCGNAVNNVMPNQSIQNDPVNPVSQEFGGVSSQMQNNQVLQGFGVAPTVVPNNQVNPVPQELNPVVPNNQVSQRFVGVAPTVVQNTQVNSVPQELNSGVPNNQVTPQTQAFSGVNQAIPNNPMSGQAMMNNNMYQQPQTTNIDDALLMAYIGKNSDKILKGEFSFGAFFLGNLYLLYRKMYTLFAIVLVAVIIAVFLPLTITSLVGFGIAIFLGIKFNELYVKHAKKEVSNIRMSNPHLDFNQLSFLCAKKGGTNIVLPIILAVIGFIFIVLVIVGLFILFSFGQYKLVCESREGNITLTYSDEAIIGYTAKNITYDLEGQKAIARRVGIDQYMIDFTDWFENNTSGSCRKEER